MPSEEDVITKRVRAWPRSSPVCQHCSCYLATHRAYQHQEAVRLTCAEWTRYRYNCCFHLNTLSIFLLIECSLNKMVLHYVHFLPFRDLLGVRP